MAKPLVSIIIVNSDGGEVFRQCLESLAKIDYPNWELIVVDNGSSDGSIEMLKRHPELVSGSKKIPKLIRNDTNLGFAPANNQGYKKAKGEYALLLNNDTTVKPDFLTKLVERIEKDKSLGVVQPKIFLMDRPRYLDNCGAFLTRTGFLEHWGFMQKNGPGFRKEREIFSAKGVCMLIRREVLEKVGLFDEDFVSYMEETDFCWRAWLAGWRILFFPRSKILHKVGFTSKRQSQIFVNYHSFKNRLNSLVKNLEWGNLFLIGGFHLVLIVSLSLYYLLRLQFSKSLMIWRAIGWNILNFPKTLAKRRHVQSIKTKRDSEIFKHTLHKTNWRALFAHFVRVEANF